MKTPEQIATAAGVVISTGTFVTGTNHPHKIGDAFRLDGRPVVVVGRVPDQKRTYIFARVVETIAARDHRIATQAARAQYAALLSDTVPPEYLRRHGALHGGFVRIDGETTFEPSIGTAPLDWSEVGSFREVVHSPGTLIHGTVSEYRSVFTATIPDGRAIYREVTSSGFGDNQRQTYWLPPDVWTAAMVAEVAARGITSESAREWLAKYHGCVGLHPCPPHRVARRRDHPLTRIHCPPRKGRAKRRRNDDDDERPGVLPALRDLRDVLRICR